MGKKLEERQAPKPFRGNIPPKNEWDWASVEEIANETGQKQSTIKYYLRNGKIHARKVEKGTDDLAHPIEVPLSQIANAVWQIDRADDQIQVWLADAEAKADRKRKSDNEAQRVEQLEAKAADYDRMSKELEQSRENADTAQAALASLQETLRTASADKAKAEKEADNLRKDRADLLNQMGHEQNELNKLQQQLEDAKRELKRVTEERDRMFELLKLTGASKTSNTQSAQVGDSKPYRTFSPIKEEKAQAQAKADMALLEDYEAQKKVNPKLTQDEYAQQHEIKGSTFRSALARARKLRKND